jgi:hypothetical protein
VFLGSVVFSTKYLMTLDTNKNPTPRMIEAPVEGGDKNTKIVIRGLEKKSDVKCMSISFELQIKIAHCY